MQKTTTLMVMPRIELKFAAPVMLEDIYEIENACFEFPWTPRDFDMVRNRDVLKAIIRKNYIIGHVSYALLSDQIEILKLAIHPDHQREGYASEVIKNLRRKLEILRRYKLSVVVRETNVDAQLFFKSHSFRWMETLEDYFDEEQSTAYLMEYNIR